MLITSILAAVVVGIEPTNFQLYYGNSLTVAYGGTRSVPKLVESIADSAGLSRPHNATFDGSGGWTLRNNYLADNGIQHWGFNPWPEGQWDYVIIQGHSGESSRIGNQSDFHLYGELLVQRVYMHSPQVEAVVYQTAAYRPDAPIYSQFPGGPLQMHNEIRDNYWVLSTSLNAKLAPVGEAYRLAGWDSSFYSDYVHPSNKGLLLNACIIFTTIYDRHVWFVNLESQRVLLGLSTTDIQEIKNLAYDATTHLFCPADFNIDGNIDPDDLGDYINLFFSNPESPRLDLNRDGLIDPDDLGDMVNRYFSTEC